MADSQRRNAVFFFSPEKRVMVHTALPQMLASSFVGEFKPVRVVLALETSIVVMRGYSG